MQCLLCGKKIPLLRKLKDPDFCSEAHRDEYAQTQSTLALSRLLESTKGQRKAAAPEPEDAPHARKREEFSESEMLLAVSRASGPKELYATLPGNTARLGRPEPRSVQALPVRTRTLLVAPRVAIEKRGKRSAFTASLVALTAAPLSYRRAPKAGDDTPLNPDFAVSFPLHDARGHSGFPAETVAEKQPTALVHSSPVAPVTVPEAPPAPAVPLPSNWVSSAPSEPVTASTPPAPEEPSVKPAMSLTVPAATAKAPAAPSTDPPVARPRPWPESWNRGWTPRNQIQDMRRLWALPIVAGGSRAPQIRPNFTADLELLLVSDPVASALESCTGLLALRPPRSKPPLPPGLARMARGEEELLTQPFIQVSGLRSEVARPGIGLAVSTVQKLIRAAVGARAALPLEAGPMVPDAISGVPLVSARLHGFMALAAKIRLALPEAKWGEGTIWIVPEAESFPGRDVHFGTLRLPPIDFDPPLNGLLALRIYPRSAGSPGEWKRSGQPSHLDLRFAGVSIPDSGLQPVKDWIPVGAGCVALTVNSLPANRLPYPGRMDPENCAPFQLPSASSCGLRLAPIRGVSAKALRMAPLRRGPEAKQHRVTMAIPAPEPGFRARVPSRPRLRIAPKAECLRKPVGKPKRQFKLALPPLFAPAKKTLGRIPPKVRWGVLGVAAAAMLAAILYQPANPGKTRVGSPQKVAAAQRKKPPLPQRTWFETFKGNLEARSAVAVTDDFSHGLADWDGRGEWATSWGYDTAGFVRTGPMALFTPTRELTDYRMEFVGQIERRSLGWVVRAADLSNYWALRLVAGGTETRPTVSLVRYPVLRGATGRAVERIVDLPLRTDMTFRVATEVKGDNYVVSVQGKVADSWTDSRLDRGGVGFFSNKGEQARVRWVGVWHQYDTLGRLCALLSSNSLLGNEREE